MGSQGKMMCSIGNSPKLLWLPISLILHVTCSPNTAPIYWVVHVEILAGGTRLLSSSSQQILKQTQFMTPRILTHPLTSGSHFCCYFSWAPCNVPYRTTEFLPKQPLSEFSPLVFSFSSLSLFFIPISFSFLERELKKTLKIQSWFPRQCVYLS